MHIFNSGNYKKISKMDAFLFLPIRPTLNICSQVICGEATAAEINELDFAAREALDNDVLGLDVAVDQLQRVDEHERLQYLLHDALQAGDGVVRLAVRVADKLAELVQVLLEQLRHDEQVLLAVEEVDQPQYVVVVGVAVGVDVLQQLDLIQGLVEEVLVVLDHLETHPLGFVLLGGQVQALQGRGEGGGAQHVVHLVAPRDDGALGVLQVLALLEAGLVRLEDHLQVEVAVHAVNTHKPLLSHDLSSAETREK
jgi:hypothetical protein